MNTVAKDLFVQAQELEPAERDTFLAKACGNDAELRLEVQRMLVEAERADSFFAGVDGATLGAEEFNEAYAEKEGDVIGNYKLLQKIGEGGFGVVYMAEQSDPISRMVALKVVKAGMDTRQVLARFEAERQALAMMDHQNIARVLDAGATASGRPYFAMELVKGVPITEFCGDQKYGPRRRLELFSDVCSAINHAHQKGVIHRDLKPSNVMVTLHGDKPVVKVIDFGIAKATQQKLTDKTLFTRFEQFLGTPVYMSPEQAAMSGLDIDTRSDVYSLGVLLYELLAGAPPFDQKSLLSAGYDEMRRIIREEEPPCPSTKLTETQGKTGAGAKNSKLHVSSTALRGELDWIVMKAIEKDRSRRYETANAFAADIGRYLSDEPVEAAAPSKVYRFRKFARRNRSVLGVAAVISLLLVAGVAVSTWQAVRATRAEQLARETAISEQSARLAEAKQRKSAESNARQARLNLYAADMYLAQAAVKANNLGRAARLLDRHIPKEGEEDLRHWEWRYLWRQIQGDELYSLPAFDYDVFNIDHSPDGRHLAVALYDGRILIWDLKRNRQVKALTPASGEIATCLYSPDGTTLMGFHLTGEGIRRWDARTLAEKSPLTALKPLDEGRIRDLSVSENGRFVAALGSWRDSHTNRRVGRVIVWDGDSGDQLWAKPGKVAAYHTTVVRFSADASKLFVGETDGRIRRLDSVTGEVDRSWLAHDGLGISALAVSPDGRILASGSAYTSGDIKLWDASTGVSIATLTGHSSWVSWLEFSADGKILASASADQTARIWDMETLTTQSVLRGHQDELYTLSLSPDASQLVTGSKDGSVSVWSAQPKEREKQHLSRSTPQQRYHFSPNGEYLFIPTETGTILELDPVTLEDVGVIQEFGTNARLVFSPDSKRIFVGDLDSGTKIYDLSTRALERTLDGVRAFRYVPNVDQLLSFRPKTGEIDVWDASTWKIVATFPNVETLNQAEVSADRQMAVFEEAAGFISVVRVSSDLQMTSLTKFKAHRRELSGMAFSPDGQLLATVAQTGLGFLWNTDDWTRVAALRGHAHAIHGVGFSPDSRRVLTSGANQDAIKLWDTISHQEVMNLAAEGSFFRNPAYLEDGRTLVATSMNIRQPALHVWRAPTWEEIAAEEAEKARRETSQ